MHFSISETEECKDETGSYTLFKISINGAHHCSVRYSQLHNLDEQLRSEFGELVPSFPPKKMFALSTKAKDDRRFQLEKYLQLISQIQKIMNSDCIINFFTNAQKELYREAETDAELTVYLMNYEKLTVSIKSYEQTEDVLEKIMQKLGMNQNYVFYFGIFLVKKDDEDSIKIVRKLQDFESPYISLKNANKIEKHRLVIRKSFFDLSYESDLYDDSVAMNLLYYQAIDELSRSLIVPDNSSVRQLEQLQAKNSIREFLRLIVTQKNYGFMSFKSCISNYPEANTKVNVLMGNRVLKLIWKNQSQEEEFPFKITRVKCWKVTGIPNYESSSKISTHLELSFEYLFSKDKMTWITLKTEQAILISMSLQTMVDEILLKKDGKRLKRPSDRHKVRATPFLTRNKSLINNTSQQSDTESISSSSANVPRDYNKNDMFENEEFITNDDL
ncbi:unnamed protein product [Brachionus calyciflorus]|uniref:Sorting nexin-17 n=1 Tax=Brachionus calyciflorus TaxID=104777 RepID=A0A813NBP1_9BILA|nr:unnamed protein product [Brachionus calyciflorus]